MESSVYIVLRFMTAILLLVFWDLLLPRHRFRFYSEAVLIVNDVIISFLLGALLLQLITLLLYQLFVGLSISVVVLISSHRFWCMKFFGVLLKVRSGISGFLGFFQLICSIRKKVVLYGNLLIGSVFFKKTLRNI